MKIRIMRDSDIDQLKKIWKICFDDSQNFIDWYFMRRFDPLLTLGIEEDGLIVSNLQMIPYTIILRDTKVPMYYLAGVATLPEFRNRGFVNLLLKEALLVMNQKEIPVSCLYPFDYGFYRKYGWEITSESLLYTLPASMLNRINPYSLKIEKMVIDRDLKVINDCYHEYMKRYDGYINRNIDDWIIRLEDIRMDGGEGYILYNHHIVVGYLFYHIMDNNVIIEEMVINNRISEQVCLQFILSLDKTNEKIIWKAPGDNNLYQELDDSRGKVQLYTEAMSRITNVMMLFRMLKIASYIKGKCVIQIIDVYASNNHSSFCLEAKTGKLECSLTADYFDISCTIGTLTQIVWGYLTPFQALHADKIQLSLSMHPLEFLEQLFPVYSTVIYDKY